MGWPSTPVTATERPPRKGPMLRQVRAWKAALSVASAAAAAVGPALAPLGAACALVEVSWAEVSVAARARIGARRAKVFMGEPSFRQGRRPPVRIPGAGFYVSACGGPARPRGP